MDALERAIDTIHRQNKKVAVDYTKGKDVTVITLLCEEAEVAIKALYKQVPKKIDRVGNKCPVCKCYLASEPVEDHYCFNCGQAIDWSAEE